MPRSLAPIALFCYKRKDHLQKTVESLISNEEFLDSPVYFFSDGPKSDEEKMAVEEVRRYIESLSNFSSKKTIFRTENWGLSRSIITGVDDVLKDHSKLIVLEDDMIVSPYFLRYMNEALVEYENVTDVCSIHGYNFPLRGDLPEVFLMRGSDCWGWATWRRGWDLFEPDGQKLLDRIRSSKRECEFNYNGAYNYVDMLEKQIQRENDSWAIRWYASTFLANKLTLHPGHSMVHNIGMDDSGTHCESSDVYTSNVWQKPVNVKIDVSENLSMRRRIEDFYWMSSGRARQSGFFRKIKKAVWHFAGQ